MVDVTLCPDTGLWTTRPGGLLAPSSVLGLVKVQVLPSEVSGEGLVHFRGVLVAPEGGIPQGGGWHPIGRIPGLVNHYCLMDGSNRPIAYAPVRSAPSLMVYGRQVWALHPCSDEEELSPYSDSAYLMFCSLWDEAVEQEGSYEAACKAARDY